MKNFFIKSALILSVVSSSIFAANTPTKNNVISHDEMGRLIKIIKKKLPLKLDKYTIATDIKYLKKEKEIKFYYKINIKPIFYKKFIEFLKNDKVKEVCRSRNVKNIINSGYKVDYIYKVGDENIKILISKEKCDKILNKVEEKKTILKNKTVVTSNNSIIKKVLEEIELYRQKNIRTYKKNRKKKGPGIFIINSYPDYKNKSIVYEYNFFDDYVFESMKKDINEDLIKETLIKKYKQKICNIPLLAKFLNSGGAVIYKYDVFKSNGDPMKEKPKILDVKMSGKCN